MKNNYLERILTAQVYDVAIQSPLDPVVNLSERIHNQVLLKREDLQQVFSFKLRGAYNKMIKLAPAVRNRGVIAASSAEQALDALGLPQDLVAELEGRLRSQQQLLGKIFGVMFPPLFGCRTNAEFRTH